LTSIDDLAKIPELHEQGEFLQVNCSHAVIRWFHKSLSDVEERIHSFIERRDLLRETRLNLFLALCVHGNTPKQYERALKRYPEVPHERYFRGSRTELCGAAYDELDDSDGSMQASAVG
jgi:hypothetical protein